MTGCINSILKIFYHGENRITPGSIWNSKIEEARANLQNLKKIQYVLGYPQGAEPTFYVLCESEEIMEHTKDWLNCALPRFYCKYARPCKEAEFEFETSLLERWPHGFLKITIWSQQRTEFDTDKYKKFIRYAVSECQTALDEMILRSNDSPNIRKMSDKSIGILIKAFMVAYREDDLERMVRHYDEIVIRDDIERRNKDTLKFMCLEKEQNWKAIIRLAHERNVSAQVVSSAVMVAILNALVFTSCKNGEALHAFEIDWPKLNESAQEFYPVLVKSPVFEIESEWRLWAIIAHVMNIESMGEIAFGHIEQAWLDKLMGQDTSINAEKLVLDDRLDLSKFNYDESSIAHVLNYAQTCHESEVIDLYEWVEGAPLKIKMCIKSQPSFYRFWQQLEVSATNYFQKFH
ncbi:hypothetical protein CXF72_17030 [Psychromonas sp. MB-3u-54]|uniref:hypothetical protein n=1 Tax=Psychromonas sp. MB-3u-54 TaxID=2058319 RepID=UPI000C3456DB|nr:hypothetical protein [Psychromonas sp. MB-3u-54]PKH01376.1 hypothetical protein CXF72_17030 [Psychromonas sp. MB-3u-54]